MKYEAVKESTFSLDKKEAKPKHKITKSSFGGGWCGMISSERTYQRVVRGYTNNKVEYRIDTLDSIGQVLSTTTHKSLKEALAFAT